MHSVRMTTTDTLSPLLPPDDGAMVLLTSEEQMQERSRLRSGSLKKLSRLILFSPDKPYLDPSCFSIVAVESLKELPVDVTADKRMSFSARAEVRQVEYSGGGVKSWKSAVFARLEERK